MEGSFNYKRPGKRKLYVSDDDDENGKVYKFKILLPNGTSVEMTLRDPDPEMPLDNFISLVKEKYLVAPKRSQSVNKKRDINWKGCRLFLQDVNDAIIRNIVRFENYKPHRCHILRLHDESSDIANTFENMWDLTPDTDLLSELPDEYTFETALADLIDNSLQAVWSNGKNERRLIRVNVDRHKISIFDSGPGMDDTDENSLVKWGKMGASLNRSSKSQAIGGKPPYLKPYFGMFGYGGPTASMHLGRTAVVSSKTKHIKKVYMMHFEREALLSSSSSGLSWKTDGGIRDPSVEEIRDSSHGSFTKVEIFNPKLNCDICRLQCHLKDIYFPYIQCDDVSEAGQTITPIEFQVNGVDMAEIEGGEVAITNWHSCNGLEFVLQLHFSIIQNLADMKSPGSRACQKANARLRLVYFPFREGKENIDRILEKLKADGCEIKENFRNFSRVSIRRLGRLLPDARWAMLPFMDLRNKKGNRADLLKRCFLRVKCFIETDAGFKPTSSKTDLAHHNPFTTALKKIGSKVSESDVVVEIFKAGKRLTPFQLEKEYQEWVLHMHERYDEEVDSGEDQPVIIVSPPNKKELGISSDVVRVHQELKRKDKSWKRGQKIKVFKGACAGCRNNIYATIEYFLLEGFEGDAGGDARIICRSIDVPNENGCVLSVGNEHSSLDLRSSLSLPLTVIDSEKLVPVESIEWDSQLIQKQQKLPALIDLLSLNHCAQLEVDGTLPNAPVFAGQVPPTQIVAVVRPVNFMPGTTDNLDQKGIFKSNIEMTMEVKFMDEGQNSQDLIHSERISPEAYKGFNGLYFFPIGSKFPDLFHKAGVYIFAFSLIKSSCKNCEKRVIVKPSSKVGKWRFKIDEQGLPLKVRVGLPFPPLAIAGYDIYDNRTCFSSIPEVTIKLQTAKGLQFKINQTKTTLSTDRLTLNIEDLLVESKELDSIRPGYGATLVIASSDKQFLVSIPCQVSPGSLQHVALQSQILENLLLPSYVFKDFVLEMFDAYGNHVSEGSEVTLSTSKFIIQDHEGMIRKVDANGKINLSGLLKLIAGFGEKASLSVLFEDKIVFEQKFSTMSRKLRIASKMPSFCNAGGQLENILFEIVDPDGDVDMNIHHSDKDGQSHMLTIKSGSFQAEESIRYTFKHGRCAVLAIPIPLNEGTFHFLAAHSRYPELNLIVEVPVVNTPEVGYDVSQLVYLDKSIVPLQDSSSFDHERNLISVINEDGELQEMLKIGQKIGQIETYLGDLNSCKAEFEQEVLKLQEKVDFHQLSNMYNLSKDELKKRIESMVNTAAAVICCLLPYQMPQKNIMDDIINLVALLGTVHCPELSRILAEYLGEEKMLAVVCRTFDAASALERYTQSGEVDFTLALHAKAAALGKPICQRFLVLCLEDIRPYNGFCERHDPQRKLSLPSPTLANGSVPTGFLGYAVNMIELDNDYLQTRAAAGHGLRETVLFSLFRKLQVYETREYMMAARACIDDGAVSLDGGIIRETGIISLGYGNPLICFPCESKLLLAPEKREVARQIEELKSKLMSIEDDIGKETKRHKKYLNKFRKRQSRYAFPVESEAVLNNCQLEYEYKPNIRDSSNMHE